MTTALRTMFRFSWPLALANAVGAVNSLVAGVLLARHSATALTAAMPASALAGTVTAFFSSVIGYAGTIIAQRHGGGKSDEAVATLSQALWLTACAAPLFFAVALLGRPVFSAFGHTEPLLRTETTYFTLLLAAGFLTVLAGVLGGFLTGQGKTRVTGLVTTFGTVLNMALLSFFVTGRGLPVSGVTGAGLAAILSGSAVCLVLGLRVARDPLIGGRLDARFRPNARLLAQVLRLGLPNGLRQLVDYGAFFVFNAVVAGLDVLSAAASTAVITVYGLPFALESGLASATEIACGRAYGAGDVRGIRAAFRSAMVLAAVLVALFALVLAFFGTDLLMGFLPSDAASPDAFRRLGRELYVTLWLTIPFEVPVLLLFGRLRGLGRTAKIFRVQMFTTIAILLPLIALVARFHPTVFALRLTLAAHALANLILLLVDLAKGGVSGVRQAGCASTHSPGVSVAR